MASKRGSGRRSDYQWLGGFGSTGAIAEAVVINNLVQSNVAGTLVRSRGEVILSIDGPADGDKIVIGCGLMIASDAQVVGGIAGFPSPIGATDADWLWHSFVPLQSQSATQDQALGDQVARLVIDSKAMRKVKQNDNVVIVFDGDQQSGTPVVDATFGVRFLFGF